MKPSDISKAQLTQIPSGVLPASTMANPLIVLLDELETVIERLKDAQYSQRPVGVIESSVGAHVRHCLDHVRALLDGVNEGRLSYEHRQRGTAVETSRTSAITVIRSLINELQTLPSSIEQASLRISVMMCCDGPANDVPTSVGREFAYVLAHTIHHNALIAAMVKTLGGHLPERFGYAPSTLKHLKEAACVR